MDPPGGMTLENRFHHIHGAIVVALSGGPDSAAIASLAKSADVGFRCIHVDHGLPASPMMRHAAEQIAVALDVGIEVAEVDPAASTETALRAARYEALLTHSDEDERIVTGHTSDDQAETVLMNLLRGAGPRGLAGIPARRGQIVRPFLDVSAAELRAIAVERGLPFVDDPENLSLDHLRNRVRAELLPLLQRDYQPEIRSTLTRTARNMADLADMLESVVSQVPLERSRFGIRAPLGRLAAADQIVRRQVYRKMLTTLRPPTPPSEDEVIRVEATFSGAGASEFTATDVRSFIDGPWLVIGIEGQGQMVDTPAIELIHGATWGDFRFRYERSASEPVRLSRWRYITDERRLWVRSVRPDDVIAMKAGSKSVVDAVRERQFSPAAHPIVTDEDDRVAWVPGVRHAWTPSAEKPSAETGYLVIVVDQDSPWAPFEP